MKDQAVTKPLISGFNVLAIYVSDLERARKFYVDVLGMTVDEDNSTGDKGIILRAADLMFYLEGGRDVKNAPGMTQNTVSPCFAADSVRDAYEQLKSKGILIVEDYVQPTDTFAMFRVADPDGNVIEFAGKP